MSNGEVAVGQSGTAQAMNPEDLAESDAYYVFLGREGDTARYRSSIHAQGAWQPIEQHMAPATGIIAHELAQFQPREGMRAVRYSMDIWGMIPGGEFTITTSMVRPGRTIELVEARLEARGRTAIVAHVWRLATSDTTDVALSVAPEIPGPEDLEEWQGMTRWPGGYIASLSGRQSPSSTPEHGVVWLHSAHPLVEGEKVPASTALMGHIDSANGVCTRLGLEHWMYPNVDLQIHLFRQPQGEWLGLDAAQSIGPDGVGLTSTTLHDTQGPFGRAEQILTVRRNPGE